jgi:hypothetical protein
MSEQIKPDFDPIWLRCRQCAYAWDDWLPVHVPIDTAAASGFSFASFAKIALRRAAILCAHSYGGR